MYCSLRWSMRGHGIKSVPTVQLTQQLLYIFVKCQAWKIWGRLTHLLTHFLDPYNYRVSVPKTEDDGIKTNYISLSILLECLKLSWGKIMKIGWSWCIIWHPDIHSPTHIPHLFKLYMWSQFTWWCWCTILKVWSWTPRCSVCTVLKSEQQLLQWGRINALHLGDAMSCITIEKPATAIDWMLSTMRWKHISAWSCMTIAMSGRLHLKGPSIEEWGKVVIP